MSGLASEINKVNDFLMIPAGVWIILFIALIAIGFENAMSRWYNKRTCQLDFNGIAQAGDPLSNQRKARSKW